MAEAGANLGSRLRQCRDRLEIGQRELARRSGVPFQTISWLESGERSSTSSDNLRKLADALQVSTDYLLGRTDEESSTPDVVGTDSITVWECLLSVPIAETQPNTIAPLLEEW